VLRDAALGPGAARASEAVVLVPVFVHGDTYSVTRTPTAAISVVVLVGPEVVVPLTIIPFFVLFLLAAKLALLDLDVAVSAPSLNVTDGVATATRRSNDLVLAAATGSSHTHGRLCPVTLVVEFHAFLARGAACGLVLAIVAVSRERADL
jgi:hypothetical protein